MEVCQRCVPKRQPKSKVVRAYQYERIVSLSHGALFNARRIFWSIKNIAEVLGMPWTSVKNVLNRF